MWRYEKIEGKGYPIEGTKRVLFLLFIILHPINIRFSWTPFLLATIISTLQRNGIISDPKRDTFISKPSGFLASLLEEEVINGVLLFFSLPAGTFLRFSINICLWISAIMNVADLGLD
jgi:hypothetical protein